MSLGVIYEKNICHDTFDFSYVNKYKFTCQ